MQESWVVILKVTRICTVVLSQKLTTHTLLWGSWGRGVRGQGLVKGIKVNGIRGKLLK